MDAIAVIALGLAMAFNFGTIYWKLKHGNIANALLDGVILGLVMYLTAGSVAGLSIGTIASAVFSVYLFFDPVNTEKIYIMYDILMGYIMDDSKKRKKRREKKRKKEQKKKDELSAKKRSNLFASA